mmetsp:Transcript_6310/g.8954  ORF Transcript_6310/g.8954 Transcript_6310/m.8954 type:complete len:205 (-) Transcript_6310:434-1048(-)
MVTLSTVGMAIGTPPIKSTSTLLIPLLNEYWKTGHITMMIAIVKTVIKPTQKRPILTRTIWKWLLGPPSSTSAAALPKNVAGPVATTRASHSPILMTQPEYRRSPFSLLTGRDSPVIADWSALTFSPAMTLASAGTISPSLIATISPGTSSRASIDFHSPLRFTFASGLRDAIKASTASPAFVSSTNPIVALTTSKNTIPIKSG